MKGFENCSALHRDYADPRVFVQIRLCRADAAGALEKSYGMSAFCHICIRIHILINQCGVFTDADSHQQVTTCKGSGRSLNDTCFAFVLGDTKTKGMKIFACDLARNFRPLRTDVSNLRPGRVVIYQNMGNSASTTIWNIDMTAKQVEIASSTVTSVAVGELSSASVISDQRFTSGAEGGRAGGGGSGASESDCRAA
ncbi:hypothetical protein EVAR_31214_1 [Eumeta japonica]|uniref:Uncharacterized protein n=1 Tax=Eumeta variegata TaxID=151549 RepID=A0A4C1VXJ2_EUMVA|nr:hypothetical protein EVAR_31214_1 [Eumeta japonica]